MCHCNKLLHLQCWRFVMFDVHWDGALFAKARVASQDSRPYLAPWTASLRWRRCTVLEKQHKSLLRVILNRFWNKWISNSCMSSEFLPNRTLKNKKPLTSLLKLIKLQPVGLWFSYLHSLSSHLVWSEPASGGKKVMSHLKKKKKKGFSNRKYEHSCRDVCIYYKTAPRQSWEADYFIVPTN